MKIAILMTVHNRKHQTLACLKSLFQAKVPETYSIEVYLTNDGCTDGTPEEIRLLYPSVHILNGSGDLYWNRGMYTAWKEAELKDFDYYLWLNDDTLLLESSIKFLLRCAEELNNQAIIVGASFTVGGVLPLMAVLFTPLKGMEYWLYGFTTIFLIILGAISAKTGGSSAKIAILRITIWGTIAMGLSALVGYIFGVTV